MFLGKSLSLLCLSESISFYKFLVFMLFVVNIVSIYVLENKFSRKKKISYSRENPRNGWFIETVYSTIL